MIFFWPKIDQKLRRFGPPPHCPFSARKKTSKSAGNLTFLENHSYNDISLLSVVILPKKGGIKLLVIGYLLMNRLRY